MRDDIIVMYLNLPAAYNVEIFHLLYFWHIIIHEIELLLET